METERMSKMNEDASVLKSPITYGDILGAGGKVGQDAVTPGDAALMQSAEARTYGQTLKDGAASLMQAAAEENVKAGFVQRDDQSQVAVEGVLAQEVIIPGAEIDMEYVAGQPVMGSVKPLPTDSFLANTDAVTIGDALEAAAVGAGGRPVDRSDASAIQSAVMRATGGPPTAGGLAAAAQSAADRNQGAPPDGQTTLADVLMDASIELEADKVATPEDASKVLDAELRNSPTGEPHPGGVAAALQAAADLNVRAGIVEPATDEQQRAFPLEDTPVPASQESVVVVVALPGTDDVTSPAPGDHANPAPGDHAKED